MKNIIYKNKIEVIIISIVTLTMLIAWGMEFSNLFIIVSGWFIYGLRIVSVIEKHKGTKIFKIIKNVYKGLVIIFITSFIIIEGYIIYNISTFKEAEEIKEVEYLLVLGAAVFGEEVSDVLRIRLDEAIEYYKANEDVKIIVSGGLGEYATITEAEAMSRYLLKNGVEAKNIIKEDKARTTLENIQFTKEILESRGYEDGEILISSNDFHLPRAMLIGKILGVDSIGLSSKTSFKTRTNYLIREYPTMVIDIARSIKSVS